MTQSDTVSSAGPNLAGLSEAEVLAEMERILASSEFDGAARIQSFLRYVVQETLAGRAETIRSKTIAEDVYHRTLAEGRDPMAVVRVDAGRLRRRLSNYYGGTGRSSRVRIHMDPGGYVPRIETVNGPDPLGEKARTPPAPASRQIGRFAAVFALGLAMGLGGLWIVRPEVSAPVQALKSSVLPRANTVREALFLISPAKLQAANLSQQARSLMFPALGRARLELVHGMFELVIAQDPTFFGGYAGASQVESLLAVNTPPGPARAALLAQARDNAAHATRLAADEGWSHSALALLAFARRDFDGALDSSARAKRLSPEDDLVLNFDALIALFGGEFERSIDSTDARSAFTDSADQFPFRNVLAAANYHLGHDDTTIALFNEAARAGDSVSPITVCYLIAANMRTGDTEAAKSMRGLLDSAWPGYPWENMLLGLFKERAHAMEIIDQIKMAESVE